MNLDTDIREGDKNWGYLTPDTVAGINTTGHTQPSTTNPQSPTSAKPGSDPLCEKRCFDYDEEIYAVNRIPTREPIQDEPLSQIATDEPLPDQDEFHEEHTDNYITARGVNNHSKEELGENYSLFWHHMGILNVKENDQADKEP